MSMTPNMSQSLQELFLLSGGAPIVIDGRSIVQLDRIPLVGPHRINLRFVGASVHVDNAVVIAVRKPGKIFLSDGNSVNAVKTWDDPLLPRFISYTVEPCGNELEVFNKYRIRHNDNFVTEDSFTGNAGMIVSNMGHNIRRYECSNALGPFAPNDLIFDLEWEKM